MADAPRGSPPARAGERKRVLMRGTVYTPDGAFSVWLRDISAKGALVAADRPLPADCDVIFKRGPIFAAARVAWTSDSGAGLTFYRDLAECDVASATLPLPGREG